MAIHVRGLDLTNGVEVVATGIEINAGGDIDTQGTLTSDGGGIFQGGIVVGWDGVGTYENTSIELYNLDETPPIQITNSSETTEILALSIENTKATLEDGDILVYNTANETFKVDNISNYVTAGTGNYHVLKVEFSAGSDFATTTVIPEGAQIEKLFVVKPLGLTTGTAPLTFSIGDVSNITLATQGVEIDNTTDTNGTGWALETPLIIGTGESGTFRSNWAGAGPGTGSGYGYLFYWTELL